MTTAKLLAPDTVAELVGCAVTDLRNWRRLPPEHPRQLASTKVDGKHRYDAAVVTAWLERPENKLYAEHVVAAFAPDEVRENLLPDAMTRALRGHIVPEPAPLPASTAWLGWDNHIEQGASA